MLTLCSGPASAQGTGASIDALCAPDYQDRARGLSEIVTAAPDLPPNAVARLADVMEAFGDRKLRCADGRALVEAADGLVSPETMQPVAGIDPTTASAAPINLKLRAMAVSGEGILRLMSADAASARLAALGTVEKRRELVTPGLLASIAAREEDPGVREAVSALRDSLLLDDADPAMRIAAIRAISADASRRNLSLLTEAADGETDADVTAAATAAIASIRRTLRVGDVLSALYGGMSYASVLFLAALGLSIIFGLMGVINLAQGELIMIGAYATWLVQEGIRIVAPPLLDAYLLVAIPVSFAAAAAVGLLMEATVIRRLYSRPLMTLLATWALSLFLVNAVRVTFGAQNLEFHQPAYISGGLPLVGDFIMTYNRLFAIGVAAASGLLVLWLFRRTRFGLNVRAVTQKREIADAMGIDTRSVDRLAFGLGSGLAGLAGMALSSLYNVNPNMGTNFIVDSFMVVVLGGVGSLAGALVAALGIGQINVIIEPLYGAVAAKVIVLLLIVLFIQKRPEGLFAPRGRR